MKSTLIIKKHLAQWQRSFPRPHVNSDVIKHSKIENHHQSNSCASITSGWEVTKVADVAQDLSRLRRKNDCNFWSAGKFLSVPQCQNKRLYDNGNTESSRTATLIATNSWMWIHLCQRQSTLSESREFQPNDVLWRIESQLLQCLFRDAIVLADDRYYTCRMRSQSNTQDALSCCLGYICLTPCARVKMMQILYQNVQSKGFGTSS